MQFDELKKIVDNFYEKKESFTLQPKKYLSYLEKYSLIEEVVEGSILEDEYGMKSANYLQFNFTFEIYVLKYYYGVEFDLDNILDQYDYLSERGIFLYAINLIPQEDIAQIKKMCELSLDQEIKLNNSVERIIANGLAKILKMIPDNVSIDKWIGGILKELKKWKPENYQKLNELMEFAKGKNQ